MGETKKRVMESEVFVGLVVGDISSTIYGRSIEIRDYGRHTYLLSPLSIKFFPRFNLHYESLGSDG